MSGGGAAIALIGMVVVGLLTAVSPIAGFATAMVVLGFVIGLSRPFALGLSLLVWGVVRFLFIEAIGGFSWAINIAEMGLLLILVVLAILRGRRDHWLLRAHAAWVMFALFVVFAGVSWFLNEGSGVELLSGLRGHLLVPVAATATALLSRGERDQRLALRIALGLAILQVPLAFYQFFAANTGLRGPDIVTGSLGWGGANNLGLWMLAMMTAAGVEYVRSRRLWLMLLIALWTFPFVAASSRLGILLSLGGIAVAIATRTRQSWDPLPYRRFVAAALAVGLVASAISVYYEFRPRSADVDLSIANLVTEQQVYRERGVSRVGYVVYGWTFLDERAASPAFGTGPASASSGAASNLGGATYLDFWYGLQLFGKSNTLDPSNPSVVPLPTQFAATLVEYGPVGLVFFMGFYAAVGAVIARRLRRLQLPWLDWRIFAFWWALCTVGTLYTNSWEGFSIIAIGFWWFPLAMPPDDAGLEVAT